MPKADAQDTIDNSQLSIHNWQLKIL